MFLFLRDETDVFTRPTRLLHFAPEPAMRKVFAERPNVEYITTDLEMADVTLRMDIHDLLFRDEVFDFVVCSHVLEHVSDDRAAMGEIRRVLRPGGIALILVPILSTPGGRTFEDPSITAPEDRERAYGQADHIRAYGQDFPDRAREAGLEVEELRPADRWNAAGRYALSDRDILYIGRRAVGEAEAVQASAVPQNGGRGGASSGGAWFDTRIAPRDAMARPDRLDHYFRVGLKALRLIEDAISSAGAPMPRSILDLPCGYGRVLRMLSARFPSAAITACDLDSDGVEFCERTFRAQGAISERDLDDLALPGSYELIWCGSLLTHLPEGQVEAALRALGRHLAPGGLLVFTTHGARIRESLESPEASPDIESAAKAELLRGYDSDGFGFAPYMGSPEGRYGYTLSARAWVEAKLSELLPQAEHRSTLEAGWDGRQDVYVCQRVRG